MTEYGRLAAARPPDVFAPPLAVLLAQRDRDEGDEVSPNEWNCAVAADMIAVVGPPTDRELWQQAVDGDGDTFGLLFDRHAKAVYNFCFRRLADWADAEDAMSEVFLVAWQRRSQVQFTGDGDGVLPWLLGVALNVVRNRTRSRRRGAIAIARLDERASEDDFSDEVLGRLSDEREMARLLEVFEQLAAQEQDVLALCAWGGLGYGEAAVALEVPVGTIRSRLARARAHLRELVDASGHELGSERVDQTRRDR